MHIADGALSGEVLVTGTVLAVAGTAIGLRRLDMEAIPATGVLAAAFFVASLVHIPVGLTSVHLLMSGLAGLVLGWAAFPAIAVALLLQMAFFGFGGVTVLGVNTFNIAAPAVLLGLLCRRGAQAADLRVAALWGALAGAGSVALAGLLVALSLALSGDEFLPAARVAVLIQVPVIVVEGIVTAAAVHLIRRVRPEVLA